RHRGRLASESATCWPQQGSANATSRCDDTPVRNVAVVGAGANGGARPASSRDDDVRVRYFLRMGTRRSGRAPLAIHVDPSRSGEFVTSGTGLESDMGKAGVNRPKHGESYEDGVTVFGDAQAHDGPDLRHSNKERRPGGRRPAACSWGPVAQPRKGSQPTRP